MFSNSEWGAVIWLCIEEGGRACIKESGRVSSGRIEEEKAKKSGISGGRE